MKCANPNWNSKLVYLRGGALRLLEMECTPEHRLLGQADGFPIAHPTARYFWLCGSCATIFAIRRWTPEGLILETLPSQTNGQRRVITVAAIPAVDPASIVHFRLPSQNTA